MSRVETRRTFLPSVKRKMPARRQHSLLLARPDYTMSVVHANYAATVPVAWLCCIEPRYVRCDTESRPRDKDPSDLR